MFASVEGTCSRNIVTDDHGGGAYSDLHKLTSAKRIGDAGYYQEAGGAVSFAMEASDSISFRVEDVGMDGLGAGDKIHLDFEVDLLNFQGTLGSTNDSPGRGDGLAGRLGGMGAVAERSGLPSSLKRA